MLSRCPPFPDAAAAIAPPRIHPHWDVSCESLRGQGRKKILSVHPLLSGVHHPRSLISHSPWAGYWQRHSLRGESARERFLRGTRPESIQPFFGVDACCWPGSQGSRCTATLGWMMNPVGILAASELIRRIDRGMMAFTA